MANEPERPIEKLLRAAAQKRRDEAGAPLELHPATRRLLQGEVARRFVKPERAARSHRPLVARLWPRVAWGVAILAVLVVAVWFLVPWPGIDAGKPMLAKNEPIPQAAPARALLPPPPATPTAAVPPSPAPVTKVNPSAATFARTARPTPSTPPRQPKVEEQLLPKDSVSPQTGREAGKTLGAAATPQLAERKKAAVAEIAASGGTPVPVPAESVNGSSQPQFGLAGRAAPPGGAPAATASPPPVAATPAPVSHLPVNEAARRTREKADQPAVAYKSLPAVASASSPKFSRAATDSFAESAAAARGEAKNVSAAQPFAQVAPEAKTKNRLTDKVSPAQPVLTSFQVEQSGAKLRIIDSDGSVYSGVVQLAAGLDRRRSVNGEKPAAALALKSPAAEPAPQAAPAAGARGPAAQNYYFRVAGTNRTLHKKVVFTGNLVAVTNLTRFTQLTNALSDRSAVGGFLTAPAGPNPLPLLNVRISGKAVIGDRKEIEINAVPTAP